MENIQGALSEFHRASVSDQAAAALRKSILEGTWGELLPGEHELARRLGVSRPTVRTALAQLALDGLITIKKGCRTRLRTDRTAPVDHAPPTVCLVVPSSRESLGLGGRPVIMEMRARFAECGVGWEEIFDRTLGRRHPESRLASIVSGRRHVCWLLLGASSTIQRWFAETGVPALVLGSCHEGIKLPFVDVNYHAIGWHAAGYLAKHGHRSVAVVIPQQPFAGDLACLRGLVKYGDRTEMPVSVIEIAAGSSRAGLLATLDRVLRSANAPTAIFCMHVEHLLMVLVHLLRSGRRVPTEVSVICRETVTSLDRGLPEITRYQSPTAKQARMTVRVAQSMLSGHPLKKMANLILPAFVAGETVARSQTGVPRGA